MALHPSLPHSHCAASCPSRRVAMLRRFAQHAVLPRLLSSGRPSSRGLLQQVHSTANDSNGISSSASLNKVKDTLQILERSLMYEANGQYHNSQGAQQTFASFAAGVLRAVEQSLSAAAAQDPRSAAGPVSSLVDNLRHYAELLDQYEGFQYSQRQKLVEGIQLQLLPQVNALAGLPIPSVLTHSRNTPQILVTQVWQQEPFKQQVTPPQEQQQQQQQQQEGVKPRASVKQRGPQLGPVGAKRQRLKQQPLPQQGADAPVETSQPRAQQQQATQQQQQQQETRQQQPVQQQQEPPEKVQEQEQLAAPRRRPGPPGPRSRPLGPRLTRSAAIPPASLGHSTGHTQQAQQQQQQQQQPPPEQQQQQRGRQEEEGSPNVPRRPSSPAGPPRGPPMRQHSAPASVWRPPASSSAAAAAPPSAPAAAAPPAVSPKDGGQHLPAIPQRPAAPGPLLHTSSSTGPYPPRRHTPYPREPTGEELQLLHQMHQPQQVMPAWQLYFPLPEELGGPARHTVAAAAAATAATTLLAPTPSEVNAGAAITTLQQQLEQLQVTSVTEGRGERGDASEEEPGAASDAEAGAADDGSSSSSAKWARNKALTEQKWQALLASAYEHQARVQQEQQRQQQEAAGELKQRTGQWLRLRESRLTGSALANMLSWFDGYNRADHVKLWREKLGLQHPPPPTEKMLYGTRNEHLALSSYQQLAPHEALREMGFALWGTDYAHEWLAASPDGLITARGLDTLTQPGAAGSSNGSSGDSSGGSSGSSSGSSGGSSGLEVSGVAGSVSEEVAEWVKQQTGSSLDGVLEIKCPFKASPHADSPHLPKKMDAYYMPQVQVLCEVLEREWAVVYYWSEGKGSHMTLVHRDRQYFDLLWRAMADFWWRHLVPAKLLLDADPSDTSAVSAVEQAYTPRLHPYRSEIIRRSRAMVDAAPQRTFTPEQTVPILSAAAAAGPAAAEADSTSATNVEGPSAGSS